MNSKDYQVKAHQFARYIGGMYPFHALSEECGEVAGVVAKALRKKGYLDEDDVKKIKKELGDVMWNVAEICTRLELDLSEVMQENIEKLSDRLARDVIVGEGDER